MTCAAGNSAVTSWEGPPGRGRVRVEESPKRIRAYLGGVPVADSRHARYVWEIPYYPAYYLPRTDVRTELLTPTGHREHSPSRGDASYFTVSVGGKTAVNAAWQYADSPLPELRDLIRFHWPAMDQWFEEDEEVFVHPRDPYKRVDTLRSSRHAQVVVNGVTVAESRAPTLLFETGLPTRYYLPQTDVRLDLLEPTATVTQCPYKGTAHYWTVNVDGRRFPDYVWSYPAPFQESLKIAGLMSFYNEKVDLIVDGDLLERPRSPFS